MEHHNDVGGCAVRRRETAVKVKKLCACESEPSDRSDPQLRHCVSGGRFGSFGMMTNAKTKQSDAGLLRKND